MSKGNAPGMIRASAAKSMAAAAPIPVAGGDAVTSTTPPGPASTKDGSALTWGHRLRDARSGRATSIGAGRIRNPQTDTEAGLNP